MSLVEDILGVGGGECEWRRRGAGARAVLGVCLSLTSPAMDLAAEGDAVGEKIVRVEGDGVGGGGEGGGVVVEFVVGEGEGGPGAARSAGLRTVASLRASRA